MVPGDIVWVSVWIPAHDALWSPDVGRAFWWLGQAWAGALEDLTEEAGFDVHTGPMITSRWSRVVCFAGLGPGEVSSRGKKVVGLSQRRTREGALFHCAVLVRWDPGRLVALLSLDEGRRADALEALDAVATGLEPFGAEEIEGALLNRLT